MTLQPLTPEAAIPDGMSTAASNTLPEIDYPDSDGNPMSDNTEQYRWIVIIKENLEIMFADDPNVFIAGDLLWYPVRYTQKRFAPDVMVAIGRPKGRRGSYKQWLEDNIAPQVVFEILSPSNKDRRGMDSLEEKFDFYETYGVKEYYIYDPDDLLLEGWQRVGDRLVKIPSMMDWVSPLLGIRFDWATGQELVLSRPDGQRFLSSIELDHRLQQSKIQVWQEQQRAEQERKRAEIQRQRAEQESQRAEQESQRANRLAARLRELGIDPDDV
ncbi:MAG: Uma2 family endonuclease [Pseudanabaena sp.]